MSKSTHFIGPPVYNQVIKNPFISSLSITFPCIYSLPIYSVYSYWQNDKKACIFLTISNFAKAYTDVLHRLHLIYGKSTEWWTHHNGRKGNCTTQRTWYIWLGRGVDSKIMRNYLYKGNSERNYIQCEFYRTAILANILFKHLIAIETL